MVDQVDAQKYVVVSSAGPEAVFDERQYAIDYANYLAKNFAAYKGDENLRIEPTPHNPSVH